ncbi:hypothetical protein [Novosphingopyxis sp.]|uniref:hypothetical protein n=1 Tax=Novosphingopyxis sp. TaxID=2709690 RepID=UPI003B5BB979
MNKWIINRDRSDIFLLSLCADKHEQSGDCSTSCKLMAIMCFANPVGWKFRNGMAPPFFVRHASESWHLRPHGDPARDPSFRWGDEKGNGYARYIIAKLIVVYLLANVVSSSRMTRAFKRCGPARPIRPKNGVRSRPPTIEEMFAPMMQRSEAIADHHSRHIGDAALGSGPNYWRDRGLKRFGSVQGEEAQEYVDISSLFDVAMGQIDQIPKGRQNGFQLEPKHAWKQNHCSRRALRSDLFAILSPRPCQ